MDFSFEGCAALQVLSAQGPLNSDVVLGLTQQAPFYPFVQRARRPLLAQLASCESCVWQGYLFPSRRRLIGSWTPVCCSVGLLPTAAVWKVWVLPGWDGEMET